MASLAACNRYLAALQRSLSIVAASLGIGQDSCMTLFSPAVTGGIIAILE
jgi:hypothetical protein